MNLIILIGMVIIIWIPLIIALKKAPVYHFDNKFKEPPGIGKTIPAKRKYSDAHMALYIKNEIGRTSKRIHS